jgi:predicted ATP-grasp superfamily ATP-dependent carboligase
LGDLRDKVLLSDISGLHGALLILRSLGRKNISTVLMAQDFLVPARFSRWHSERVCCHSSFDNEDCFMRNLLGTARTGRYLTFFPLTDSSLLSVSTRRQQLTPFLKLVLPSHESVLRVIDKSETLKLAKDAGVPIPKTFYPRNKEDVIDVSASVTYPAVIKPRRSFVWGKNGVAKYSRPLYVNSSSDLISTYAKVETDFPAPMIQEFVPGHNISVALLFERGEPRAACFIRVRRTLPVTGGNSVLRESIPPDPMLLRYASNLLKRLNWHGVAEVEFKIDSRDSTPKLMEINGRFWGSMNVAIESGVDFPYLMYLLAKGEQVRPVFRYRIGVKFRWLNADSENLRFTLKGKPKLINMGPPNKLDAILRFLQFFERDMHYDGFMLSDPLPFFIDEAVYMYANAKRIMRHSRLCAGVHMRKEPNPHAEA